jgi:hypothetical protein
MATRSRTTKLYGPVAGVLELPGDRIAIEAAQQIPDSH